MHVLKKTTLFCALSPVLLDKSMFATSDDPLLAYSLVRTTSRTESSKIRSMSATTRADNLLAINDNNRRTKRGWHTSSQFVEEERQKIELGHKIKLGWKGTPQFVQEETQIRELG